MFRFARYCRLLNSWDLEPEEAKRYQARAQRWLAAIGAMLGLVSLADGPDLFTAAMTLALSLSALALVRVLLRGMFGPSWPKRLMGERMPPPETDQDTPPESNTLTEG